MSSIDELKELGAKLIHHEISLRDAVFEDNIRNQEIDQIILNHSLPQTMVAELCGMSLNTFKERVKVAIDEGVIEQPIKLSNRWLYSPAHIHALMDWMALPRWSDQQPTCRIMNIQNQKGGTGKSSTTVSLAVSMALNHRERMRILVIDLDPQGTVRNQTAPVAINEDEIILSAVDLMLGDIEQNDPHSIYGALRQKGYQHAEIAKLSVLDTHLPNLKILPAFPSDERFTSIAWENDSRFRGTELLAQLNTDNEALKTQILQGLTNHGGLSDFVSLLKQQVIIPLQNDFDLIMIDTGPHINPLVWNANVAADCMLIPVSPRKLDWLSTTNFINNIGNQLEMLLDDPEQLRWFKLLAVNYDDENARDNTILDMMKDDCGRHLLNSQIKRSSAFEAAARHYRTVLDIRKSDNLCPDRQLDKALDSIKDVTRAVMLQLREQ